jgi:hypothetical protein
MVVNGSSSQKSFGQLYLKIQKFIINHGKTVTGGNVASQSSPQATIKGLSYNKFYEIKEAVRPVQGS